jgi:tetratricopeptide (TPR) repeat protein
MFDVRRYFAVRRRPDPRNPFACGVAAFEDGRADEALAAFAQAIVTATVPAERARARNKYAVTLVALGRHDEAREAWFAALADDERHAAVLANLGNLLLEDGHALDAIDYYAAAIRADESHAPAFRNLGVALRRLGRRREAVSALRTAVRLEARRPGRS